MPDLKKIQAEFSYNPGTGVIVRRRTQKPVYLEIRNGYPYLEIKGYRLNARRVAIALQTGAWPEKYEYRSLAEDPRDLRWENFKRRRGEGRKDCAKCGRDVELSEFPHTPQRKKDKRGSYCKDCLGKMAPTWAWKTTIKKKYNLTADQYYALLKSQQGCCAICGAEEDNGRRFAVDHDHETGEVRGLLCKMCNVGLGNFRDSPRNLLLAAKYLMK